MTVHISEENIFETLGATPLEEPKRSKRSRKVDTDTEQELPPAVRFGTKVSGEAPA